MHVKWGYVLTARPLFAAQAPDSPDRPWRRRRRSGAGWASWKTSGRSCPRTLTPAVGCSSGSGGKKTQQKLTLACLQANTSGKLKKLSKSERCMSCYWRKASHTNWNKWFGCIWYIIDELNVSWMSSHLKNDSGVSVAPDTKAELVREAIAFDAKCP